MEEKKEIKHLACDRKQDLIDDIYAGEVFPVYKKSEYCIWLDGRGYCIYIRGFDGKNLPPAERKKTFAAYETPEELVDNYVLYDGTKLSDAMEMDVEDLDE